MHQITLHASKNIKANHDKRDINREAAKISALSSGKKKKDKYDCLTGKEILHSDKRRVTKKAKFTYSPLE